MILPFRLWGINMNLSQLALNRYVVEEVKEGKKPSVSNDEKVDLDYLATYWDNIISMAEREKQKKPNIKTVAFRLALDMRG